MKTMSEWTETDGSIATLPELGQLVIVGREYEDRRVHAEFVARRGKNKCWHLGDGRIQRIYAGDLWSPAIMEAEK